MSLVLYDVTNPTGRRYGTYFTYTEYTHTDSEPSTPCFFTTIGLQTADGTSQIKNIPLIRVHENIIIGDLLETYRRPTCPNGDQHACGDPSETYMHCRVNF